MFLNEEKAVNKQLKAKEEGEGEGEEGRRKNVKDPINK
jgi:hypothetical protein